MNRLLPLAVCMLLIIASVHSQDARASFISPELGWTIKMPKGFTIIDSAANAEKTERGKQLIEQSNDVKVEDDETRTLFNAMNGRNHFGATLTPFDPAKQDWDASVAFINSIVYSTMQAQAPDATLDTASSMVTIAGQEFHKFWIKIQVSALKHFTMTILTRLHKGYQFGITYVTLDPAITKEIEAALAESVFKK